MPQDRLTGAAGNAFGRATAPLIAKAIGATMLGSRSNEAVLGGNRVVIKCAAPNTTSIGVTYVMLERLHSVVGAFQQTNGSFSVILLPVTIFASEQRLSRSQGASKGKVGLVSRSVFERKGTKLRTVHI
jgi:hypothetical protein